MSEIGERTSLAPEHDVTTPFAGTRIMHNFHLVGIDHEQFEPLFRLSDAQLKERGVVRRIATESPGFPCRICLEDADVGDELLLLPYRHQPAASPYRASGPIYIRRGARLATLAAGEVPACVSRRLMSVRAYDTEHMMVAAEVCEGSAVAPEIRRLFADDRVAYLHLHNAKQGCFSCRVDRA
jgi:hypothetical protein